MTSRSFGCRRALFHTGWISDGQMTRDRFKRDLVDEWPSSSMKYLSDWVLLLLLGIWEVKTSMRNSHYIDFFFQINYRKDVRNLHFNKLICSVNKFLLFFFTEYVFNHKVAISLILKQKQSPFYFKFFIMQQRSGTRIFVSDKIFVTLVGLRNLFVTQS